MAENRSAVDCSRSRNTPTSKRSVGVFIVMGVVMCKGIEHFNIVSRFGGTGRLIFPSGPASAQGMSSRPSTHTSIPFSG